MKLCLELVVQCSVLFVFKYRGVGSFNPDVDGVKSPTENMALVMRNGHPDMRTLLEDLEALRKADAKEAETLDVTPRQNVTSAKSLTTFGRKERTKRRRRYLVDDESLRWTHGVVPYVFREDIDLGQRNNIEQRVFGTFEYWTHFRFVPWNESVPEEYDLDHRNYLVFINSGGCWSKLGNRRGSNGQPISCCTDIECLHELGHVLGFYHEHTSPLRDDYIRINFENIQPGREANFKKSTVRGHAKLFNYYDISSVMGYNVRAFSKNRQDTITVLDPEMRYIHSLRDTKEFYMFYEAQTVYNMTGEMCPGFQMSCDNDGYVSYIEGQCRCRCPVGLDHNTGCATQMGADIWPEGHYSLLQAPGSQCPSGFHHGSITLYNITDQRQHEHSGKTESAIGNSTELTFCTKMYGHHPNTAPDWFPGDYCVFRCNTTCPKDLIQYSTNYSLDKLYTNADARGVVPDFTLNRQLTVSVCCHREHNETDTVDVSVPAQTPTVLLIPLKDGRTRCSRTVDMTTVEARRSSQWVIAENDGLLEECVYIPATNTSQQPPCGDYTVMSVDEPEVVITTPSYPRMYYTNTSCTWFFKSPENSRLALDFTTFNLPGAGATCQSYAEIHSMMPGQPGVKYCGSGFKRTIVSHRETLGLTLGSTYTANFIKASFQATIRLIQDSDLCYANEGKDGSYTGTVNFGRNFDTCIPWDRVTHCRHHVFNSLTVDLESNYCRNPGHGTEPWCYTNVETCARAYCDVCNIRKCYDLFDDCLDAIRSDRTFCSSDPEASRGCRLSCDLCGKYSPFSADSKVTCGRPVRIVNYAQLISPLRASYNVGDTVTYICRGGRLWGAKGASNVKLVNSTCTSEGTWTSMANACERFCTNQRQDCGTLLSRNPTMCYDHPEFSQQKCAYTCSLCRPENNMVPTLRCPGHVLIANVTEVTQGPYTAGDVINYTCHQGHMLVQGNLQRACLSDGTVTGQPPRCVAEHDVSTPLYTNVEIRRRNGVAKSHRVYTISSDELAIKRKGVIKSWTFYSIYGGGVTFQVWRPKDYDTKQFTLVGSNTVYHRHEDRAVTINIPETERITVRPGDIIGIFLPRIGRAAIAMDTCVDHYNPEHVEYWVPDTFYAYTNDKTYTMRPGRGCYILSVNAVIAPSHETTSTND